MPRVFDQRAWQEDPANFDSPVTFNAGILTRGGPWQDVKAFGAKGNGTTDDSAAIQNAANYAAGGLLLFPPGNYKIAASTVTLSAGTTLFPYGSTFTVGAALPNGAFAVSVPDVAIEGSLAVVGGGFQTPFWRVTSGGDRFVHRAKATVSGIAHNTTVNDPNYYINGSQTNGLWVGGGLITSTDSLIMKTDRCNGVLAADMRLGPYTANNGSNPIVGLGDYATTAGAATGFTSVRVRDIVVDGGATVAGYAPIVVAQFAINGFTNPGQDVALVDCSVRNTLGNSDGIDAVLCNQVGIANCHVNGTGNGFDIAGCNYVSVASSTALNTRNPGFQVGDPTVPYSTNLVTLSGCVAVDCGSAQVGAQAADFLIFAPAGQATNVVELVNCVGFKSNQALNLYGVGMANGVGGTFSGVKVIGGFMLGNTAGFLDSSTGAPNMTFSQVQGINPRAGGVATPGFPLTGVGVANTTAVDCQVTITAGAAAVSVSVAGKSMGSVPASQVCTFLVPAGNTITPTYASGSPSWAWFGL